MTPSSHAGNWDSTPLGDATFLPNIKPVVRFSDFFRLFSNYRFRAYEGATERAVFFDTDDFATASSYTPSGGSASTDNGIFDNEIIEVDPLSGVGVVSAPPRFICAPADLPGAAASGDAISIDSTAYTVRVIQPEGTGVTTLVLEKN